MPDPLRILCAGDIHLGRCPSGVMASERELSIGYVWERFAQAAFDHDVEAVVLTGDTVDQENKVFEAMRAVEEKIRELARGGIEVIAVAGNHDWDAFPRLLNNLGDVPLRFLGRNGQWETYTLERDGKALARFAGWSFPKKYVSSSPLKTLDIEPADVPTLGVLHCDVDQSSSSYAPVERGALERAPVEGWLMGHIHRWEKKVNGEQLQLYTGSLQPLHANEPGRHGAWLIEVDGDSVSAELLPIASLRYETVRVDLTDCEVVDDVEGLCSECIRAKLREVVEAMQDVRRVICRVVFEGRSSLARAIDGWAPNYFEEFAPSYRNCTAILDTYSTAIRPSHDLEELATSDDPPGVLAQLLLDLESEEETPLAREGLRRAKEALQQVHTASGYEPLRREQATERAKARSRFSTSTETVFSTLKILDEERPSNWMPTPMEKCGAAASGSAATRSSSTAEAASCLGSSL